MRDTYYTPPHKKASKLPKNRLGVRPRNDLLDKLLKASFQNENKEEPSGACQFGWLKKGKRYFSIYSKEYSDEHHCCYE
jgi:hypothetical protein